MPEPVPYQYPARTPPVPPGPSTWRVLGSVHGQRRAWRTHIASPQDGWPRDASYPPWGVPARPCAKDAHLTPWKAWDRRQGGEVHRLSGPKEHHGRVEETDGVCRAHTTDNSDPSQSDPNQCDPHPLDANLSDPNPLDANLSDANPLDANPLDPHPLDPHPLDPHPDTLGIHACGCGWLWVAAGGFGLLRDRACGCGICQLHTHVLMGENICVRAQTTASTPTIKKIAPNCFNGARSAKSSGVTASTLVAAEARMERVLARKTERDL